MKKYLDFIEKYSIDKNFYCRVHDIYSREEWEISWNKGAKGKAWGLKASKESVWNYYSGEVFLEMVSFNKLDVIALEIELQSKVKNMIVFVNLMLREAKNIMGEDIVEVAQSEYDEFAQSLMSTIRKLLPDHKLKTNSPTTGPETAGNPSPLAGASLRLVQADSETH